MANGISKNPLTDISKVYLNQIAEGSLKSLEKASVLAMSDDPKDQDKAREIKTRFDYQSLMKQKKAKKAVKEEDHYGQATKEIKRTKLARDQRFKSLHKSTNTGSNVDVNENVKRDEYGDPIGGPKISKKQKAKNLKANTPDEQHTTTTSEAFSDWRHDLREIIAADEVSDEPEIKEKKIKNKIKINPEFKEAVEELGGELLEVQEMDPKKQEQIKRKEKMLKKKMLRMKLRAVNQTGGEDIVAGYEPEGDMVEAKVDQGKDEASKINTRNQRTFGNRRGQKGGMHRGDDMEARRYNTEKGRGVKMKGKKDKTPVDYHGQDRKKRIDALFKEKGIKEATRYAKETGKSFKSGKPVVKGGTAKDDKAFQVVAKKYASQMMGGPQKKKVRGQKPDESNTPFKRAAARIKQIKIDNKALADKAKKAGYKSTQDYVNVQAVRKGGLGT